MGGDGGGPTRAPVGRRWNFHSDRTHVPLGTRSKPRSKPHAEPTQIAASSRQPQQRTAAEEEEEKHEEEKQ